MHVAVRTSFRARAPPFMMLPFKTLVRVCEEQLHDSRHGLGTLLGTLLRGVSYAHRPFYCTLRLLKIFRGFMLLPGRVALSRLVDVAAVSRRGAAVV